MNPHTHRLVFNPHRGCLMAVAESARSCGKGQQAAQGRRVKHRAQRRSTSTDPATTQKRLGDGFYEQRLITEQIGQLTGRRFLAGYANEEDQYKALMSAGITYAQAWNLRPGVALSAEQMARLTTDMVWLVEQEVTLPDGSRQKALVPQLYARTRSGDLSPGGGLFADKALQLDVAGTLANTGTLAGRQLVSLTAENLQNLGGRITGEDVWLTASKLRKHRLVWPTEPAVR